MKIFVSGREGQVARSLAVAASGRAGLELSFAGRPEIDLAVAGSAARAIGAARPDLVIHAAAYTAVDRAESDVELAHRVNGLAAGEVAAAAAACGARLIHISTDYVFDGSASRPYVESDPTGPVNAYGASKLAGEAAVRAAHPEALILRTSWIVSRFGQNFVKTMLRLAQTRNELAVVGDQFGCPTEAGALARALVDLAGRWDELRPGGTYHLAGSGSATWAELAEAVMQASAARGGPRAAIRPIPTADYPTPAARPRYTVLDCRRAQHDLGLVLPPWRQAIDTLTDELIRECRA